VTDAIAAALEEVEADGDAEHVEAGAGQPDQGEEPDAIPEGPLPDDDVSGQQESKFSVLSWAERIPDGSHLDFDARDWWDPQEGGKNRLAYHLSDAAGDGAGYPNGLGVLVALAEMYWSRVEGEHDDRGDDQGDEAAPETETVARSDAEALV